MAHLKHVGTFAQIRYGDQARAAGFDDAVLVGRSPSRTSTSSTADAESRQFSD
jgi:hypothetical protein